MNQRFQKHGTSIIIPCFNTGRFLLDSVASILAQNIVSPYEIIVADDCSTDKVTLDVINQLHADKIIKVVKNDWNMGVQLTRNRALSSATYDYILPLDSDDCLNTEPKVLAQGTYIDRGIELLRKSDRIAFVHGYSQMFGDFAGFTISTYPVSESMILKKHHAPTSILYRRLEALNCGGYNKSILKWQDWSFAVGLLNYRYNQGLKNEIECIQLPFHLYRIHDAKNRISELNISEKDMVEETIKIYPEIFHNFYPDKSRDQIVDIVIGSKPTKMTDLLYVAANDLSIALQMIEDRRYIAHSRKELHNIP